MPPPPPPLALPSQTPNWLFGRLDGAWQKAYKPILGSWAAWKQAPKPNYKFDFWICHPCQAPQKANRPIWRVEGPRPPFPNPKTAMWGLAKGQKAHFKKLGGLGNRPKIKITNLIFGVATLPPLPKPPKRPKQQFAKAKKKLVRNSLETRPKPAKTPHPNPIHLL